MDQIEMLWRCDTCNHINGGLSKNCSGCGKALENEKWFMPEDISTNANLHNPEDLDKALRGPDWRCPFCHSSQRKKDGECANCGGPEINNITHKNPKVFADTYEKRTIPTHYTTKPQQNTLQDLIDFDNDVRIFSKPSLLKRPITWVIGSIALLTTLVVFLLWPRTVEAEVIGSNWKSTATVERRQITGEAGWDVPFDSITSRNEGRRIHHYDKVQIGTKRVPYSESVACGQTCRTIPRTCSSNKNGTASCSGGGQSCSTKYCNRTAYRTDPVYEDQPRYRDWYSWTAWRWKHNRTIVNSGNDFAPKPPENINLNQNLNDGERERSSIDWKYVVIFQDKNKEKFNFTNINSESHFLSFHIGDHHILKVSSIGVSIKR
jgi:hypothetical protein